MKHFPADSKWWRHLAESPRVAQACFFGQGLSIQLARYSNRRSSAPLGPPSMTPVARTAFAAPHWFLRTTMRRSGQPLPLAIQRKLGHLFGADLSNVRIHTSPDIASLGAASVTMGDDVFFAPGRFQPFTRAGQQLIGHEIAHVLQQRARRVKHPTGTGLVFVQNEELEEEATHMGTMAVQLAAARPRPSVAAEARVQTRRVSLASSSRPRTKRRAEPPVRPRLGVVQPSSSVSDGLDARKVHKVSGGFTIVVIDTTNPDEQELKDFVNTLDRWKKEIGTAKLDKWMAKAWASNFVGLKGQLSSRGKGQYLFIVRQRRTGIIYMLGKLRLWKTTLDISEVVGNMRVGADVHLLDESTKEFMKFLWESRVKKLEGIEKEEYASYYKFMDDGNNALGCLFSWAALQAKKVTLTANTVGLVGLYGKYGFELGDKLRSHQKKYFDILSMAMKGSSEYNDAKFAQVDLYMELTPEGKEQLFKKYRPMVHFTGGSLT